MGKTKNGVKREENDRNGLEDTKNGRKVLEK